MTFKIYFKIRTAAVNSMTASTLAVALMVTAGMTIGCSGNDKPSSDFEAPQQVTSQVEPPPPPPLPPPIREVNPTGQRSRVRVIDPGNTNAQPETLVEASRLAKARKRAERRAPVADINDDNLAEYSEGADVIVLESEPAAPSPGSTPSLDGRPSPSDIQDEDYWRNGVLDLRMAWRRAIDDINDLELESASLRQQFYAEEDPYVRDSQIKPSWDRVLDRVRALREQAGRHERELGALLEDGRRAGALQGWLNQGWELEPNEQERQLFDQLDTYEPGEPVTRDPVPDSRN